MADTKIPLPYGTYGKLKNTVERFMESTVPTRLNRHVLDDISGVDFSGLTRALQFLGFMSDDNSLKPEFRALVEARKKGESDYKSMLLEAIDRAYKPIIKGVDLDAGTLPEIEKVFREASGYQGQMLEKAIRFYVKALEDCDVKVSEHITKPRPRAKKVKDPNAPKKRSGGGGGAGRAPDDLLLPDRDEVPKDYERQPIPGLGSAFIQYPTNLTEANCDVIEATVSLLRAYVKSRKPREGKKP